MSLESLGALRQLIQVREQNQTIQNDNLERVQNSVQQTSTSEAQRTDQLNLEKAKATYEVALAQATVETIQSKLDREAKATSNAALGILVTGVLSAADSIMNLSKDLKGQQKLKDSNSSSASDRIEAKNAKVFGGIGGNDIYVGSSGGKKSENITFKVTDENGKVDVDKAIKAGLLTRGNDGSLSVTKLGQDKGFSVDESSNPDGTKNYSAKVDFSKFDKNTTFLDGDMAIKYGMATRDINGGLVATNKGEFFGLGKTGDKLENSFNSDKELKMESETVLRATTAPGQSQIQYFQAATISQADIEMKAKQMGISLDSIKDGNTLSFEKLMQVNPKAAEDLFNENAHDIKGAEAVDAEDAFKAAIKRSPSEEKQRKIDEINKSSDPEDVKKAKIAKLEEDEKIDQPGVNKRIKELSGSLEDKLLKDGKSNMGITGGDKAKYVFNALVSFADAVVPQIQAYMAARDRMEQTAIELAAAMEKLAAAQKKLKALEEMILTLGAADSLGSGNNQVEKGL